MISSFFPYTTLFRSDEVTAQHGGGGLDGVAGGRHRPREHPRLATAGARRADDDVVVAVAVQVARSGHGARSEEHTSELQSPCNLVCRLLHEKKKKTKSRRGMHGLIVCLLIERITLMALNIYQKVLSI